jgi:hypothetical protein
MFLNATPLPSLFRELAARAYAYAFYFRASTPGRVRP